MFELPVPVEVFFNDFSSSLFTFDVIRSGILVCSIQGLTNNDELGSYVAFKYGCDIQIGDILKNDFSEYVVQSTDVDTYAGKPELFKAYY